MCWRRDQRRIVFSTLLLTIIVFSGAMSATATNNSDIDVRESRHMAISSDGMIDTVEIKIIMTNKRYKSILRSTSNTSLKEARPSGFRDKNVSNFTYSTESNNGMTTETIRFEDGDPSDFSYTSTRKENGTMIFEYRVDAILGPTNFTVTMPGNIQNTSADSIEGDTATWHVNTGERKFIYVQSNISSSSPEDEGEISTEALTGKN